MPERSDFWFPAKRYGWGWGLPVKWQGWLVLLVFVAAIAITVVRFPPHENPAAFVALVFLATAGFGLVCWWKGETPGWRWGDDDRHHD